MIVKTHKTSVTDRSTDGPNGFNLYLRREETPLRIFYGNLVRFMINLGELLSLGATVNID